jgi:hypothetical protein
MIAVMRPSPPVAGVAVRPPAAEVAAWRLSLGDNPKPAASWGSNEH